MSSTESNKSFIFLQGDHVWLEPPKKTEFSVAVGATVQYSESGRIRVVDDDGKEHWIDGRQQIRHMNVSSYTHMEDMILLGDLNEAGILRNLFLRYKDNFIYVSQIMSEVKHYKRAHEICTVKLQSNLVDSKSSVLEVLFQMNSSLNYREIDI